MYSCKHCAWEGSVPLRDNIVNFRPKQPKEDQEKALELSFDINPPTEKQYQYLESVRKIPRTTADHYELCSAQKWFRAHKEEREALGFPYRSSAASEFHAIKWRSDKKQWTQDGGAKSFFGLKQFEKSSTGPTEEDPLIITEGEFDALAAHASGYHHALSVPNGAPMKLSTQKKAPGDDRKYHFLWAARDLLENCDRAYIACDADDQGEILAEELGRRIGKIKCWRVKYPEDCKDLNDVLVKHGKDEVKKCIRDADPFPVSGLYTVDDYRDQVDDLYTNGFAKGATIGIPEVDELMTIVPGMMTVVTGVPSHGKSTFVDYMMFRLARDHGWRHAVCSFENPPALHIAKLANTFTRKPFFDGPNARMSQYEKALALDWVKDRFVFISESEGTPPTVDSVLERAKTAVMRYGINGLVIDPYSRLNVKGEEDTAGIGDMLTKVQAFAVAHGVHVWFVAHPKKPQFPDGYVPSGYDISGSAHWFNHTDFGVTVHRPKPDSTDVEVHVWKVRWENLLGKKGQADIKYEPVTNHYSQRNGYGYQTEEASESPEEALRRRVIDGEALEDLPAYLT